MKATTSSISAKQAARELSRRGYFVVPIPPGRKHPTISGWQDLLLTEDEVGECFGDADGIGLLLAPSKLTDVDCDCPEAVAAARILLPATAMIHGHPSNPASHYYYRQIGDSNSERYADLGSNVKADSMMLEVRSNGQTVVPPSRHAETGELIEWEADGEPGEVDTDTLQRQAAKVASAALIARYWPVNQRHFAALALGGMLAHGGWNGSDIKVFLRAVLAAARDEEVDSRLHDADDTLRKFADGEEVTGAPTLAAIIGDEIVGVVRQWLELSSEVDDRSDFHMTDLGNARRLVERHGRNLRYCFAWGKWLAWRGSRWVPDQDGEVARLAKETVESIFVEAIKLTDPERKQLLAHAFRSESESRIRAMIELAKTEAGISVTPDQLDSDPWLLNCLNGTIDLRTGELHDHRRENLCTKLVPVGFDPEAQCPIWDSFLERILGQNLELIKFLRRAVGYSLTGLTTEQILVFLYGTGANGKTTFIETMRHLFADYSQQADFTTLLEKKNDGPRNDLASLKGARFVAAVEAAEGRQLAEAVIKQTTGGDTIRARFLYHEFFEFKPQFKLFLVANHKPRIAGTDEAIWRRIRLIPFAVTIPKEERDQQLPEKLERELPGILTWAVRGCRSWQKNGLGEPAEVSEATAAYRREMDILADFIDESCVVGPQEVVEAGQLYRVFKAWCENNGEEPLTQKKLGEKLRERGFEPIKKGGIRRWRGFRLHHDCEDEAE